MQDTAVFLQLSVPLRDYCEPSCRLDHILWLTVKYLLLCWLLVFKLQSDRQVLYWVGRSPPDAGHLPGSHASSHRSFPSSCHVLERSNGIRDYATCRPENRAGAAVFPCCVSYGFRVSVSAALGRWLYVPMVLNMFSYIRKNFEVPRTNTRVKAKIVRRISPSIRTCKSDFNVTSFFGLV